MRVEANVGRGSLALRINYVELSSVHSLMNIIIFPWPGLRGPHHMRVEANVGRGSLALRIDYVDMGAAECEEQLYVIWNGNHSMNSYSNRQPRAAWPKNTSEML